MHEHDQAKDADHPKEHSVSARSGQGMTAVEMKFSHPMQ
jgi:hypothetical protein